jgi:hypothetical protein
VPRSSSSNALVDNTVRHDAGLHTSTAETERADREKAKSLLETFQLVAGVDPGAAAAAGKIARRERAGQGPRRCPLNLRC